MSDLKNELQQERREKEWAETWKPSEPGDMLIGTLEGYDRATTDFGEYRVVHIRDEDGVLKGLWLMHSVLQDEWEEAAPKKGDRVGAMYHGKRSGDSYDYHMWSVKVDRTAGDDAPDVDSGELFGPPAIDTETGKTVPQETSAGESESESALDDPNGGLPY